MSLFLKSSEWGSELHWPQEVVGLFEVWSTCDDFVDEVLNAVDSVFSELSSNNAVIGEWNSLSVDLSVSSLVDKLSD